MADSNDVIATMVDSLAQGQGGAPTQDPDAMQQQLAAMQNAQSASMPDPGINPGAVQQQNPQAFSSLMARSGPPPMVQGGSPAREPNQPPTMAGRKPNIVNLIQGLMNPAKGTPAGERTPSRTDVFENFLGQFLNSFSQGMAASGHGPGANLRGAAAAIQAPYKQDVQEFGQQQAAQAQQAQIASEQAKTAQTQAQTGLVGNMSSVFVPGQGMVQVPTKDVGKVMGQLGASQTRATGNMNVEKMKFMIQSGQISHLVPGVDDQGNKVMNGYNKQGQLIGALDGAIPPSSYTGNTKLTKQMDGSWSTTTTTPNLPGKLGQKQQSGAVAPQGTSKNNIAGAVTPKKEDTALDAQAKMIVEGRMDPSQVSRRGATWGTIMAKADKYSQEKYGEPFDVAKASEDYKYASNVGTQNTFKYLNSLTGNHGSKGNLDKLIDVSNTISRTDFPAINDLAAWSRMQTGDPKMAAYHTAVTEVADQVAKILQGGGTGVGTSDAKLQQAQGLFKTGFSKQSMEEVASTLRDLLGNRKQEMIGDNRYLQRQYGDNLPAAAAKALEEGHETTFKNGQIWTKRSGRPVRIK